MPTLWAIVCLFNTRYLRNEYLLSFFATLFLKLLSICKTFVFANLSLYNTKQYYHIQLYRETRDIACILTYKQRIVNTALLTLTDLPLALNNTAHDINMVVLIRKTMAYHLKK